MSEHVYRLSVNVSAPIQLPDIYFKTERTARSFADLLLASTKKGALQVEIDAIHVLSDEETMQQLYEIYTSEDIL